MHMISTLKRAQSLPWLLLRGATGFSLLLTQYDEIIYLTNEGLIYLITIFILLGGCPTCYAIHLVNAFRKLPASVDCSGSVCKALPSQKEKNHYACSYLFTSFVQQVF